MRSPRTSHHARGTRWNTSLMRRGWRRVHDIDGGLLTWVLFPSRAVPRGAPLYYASLCGFYEVAKHLVVKHPDHVNATGGQIVSPLGAALYRKHLQVSELLYEHGANVRVRGPMEFTSLHAASVNGSVDATRWLLNHGADANAQIGIGSFGWTSLHLAAWGKHLEIIQMLLGHHGNVHAQTPEGEVALHLATSGIMGDRPHYITRHPVFFRPGVQSRVHACFSSMAQISMQKTTRATLHSWWRWKQSIARWQSFYGDLGPC